MTNLKKGDVLRIEVISPEAVQRLIEQEEIEVIDEDISDEEFDEALEKYLGSPEDLASTRERESSPKSKVFISKEEAKRRRNELLAQLAKKNNDV